MYLHMVHVYLDDVGLWKQVRLIAIDLGIPTRALVATALREFVAVHTITGTSRDATDAEALAAGKRVVKKHRGALERLARHDVTVALCANPKCGHTRATHKDGTGRCDHCLSACRAFVEA